jgi:hypothetical protein
MADTKEIKHLSKDLHKVENQDKPKKPKKVLTDEQKKQRNEYAKARRERMKGLTDYYANYYGSHCTSWNEN